MIVVPTKPERSYKWWNSPHWRCVFLWAIYDVFSLRSFGIIFFLAVARIYSPLVCVVLRLETVSFPPNDITISTSLSSLLSFVCRAAYVARWRVLPTQ